MTAVSVVVAGKRWGMALFKRIAKRRTGRMR